MQALSKEVIMETETRSKTVAVRLPPPVHAKLLKLAKKRDWTLTQVIEWLIMGAK